MRSASSRSRSEDDGALAFANPAIRLHFLRLSGSSAERSPRSSAIDPRAGPTRAVPPDTALAATCSITIMVAPLFPGRRRHSIARCGASARTINTCSCRRRSDQLRISHLRHVLAIHRDIAGARSTRQLMADRGRLRSRTVHHKDLALPRRKLWTPTTCRFREYLVLGVPEHAQGQLRIVAEDLVQTVDHYFATSLPVSDSA